LRHPGQPGRVRCEAGHDTGRSVVARSLPAPRVPFRGMRVRTQTGRSPGKSPR
jgi:hypothetical protein